MPDSVLLLLVSWVIAHRTQAMAAEVPEVPSPPHLAKSNQCGYHALRHFLRLQGHARGDAEILRALPSPVPEGFSMGELVDTSARLGFPLKHEMRGVHAPVESPSIVYLNEWSRGHFVCVAPRDDLTVEVHDGPDRITRLTWRELTASPAWTGHILAADPGRAGPVAVNSLPIGLAGPLLLLPFMLLWRRARGRTKRVRA